MSNSYPSFRAVAPAETYEVPPETTVAGAFIPPGRFSLEEIAAFINRGSRTHHAFLTPRPAGPPRLELRPRPASPGAYSVVAPREELPTRPGED